MKTRAQRLMDKCKDLDGLVIHNATEPFIDQTFFYVTELSKGLFEGSAAIVSPDGHTEVLTSRLEETTARTNPALEVNVYKARKNRVELLSQRLKGLKKIGINYNELTHSTYLNLVKAAPKAEFIDVGAIIKEVRLTKTRDEIALLKKAGKMASDVAKQIPDLLKEGVKEYEVAAEINYMMMKKGAQGPSFDTIAAFGANSAEPHYTAGDSPLLKKKFALFDFGALYNRYRSDITRTYVFGKATPKMREIYETVLEAQLAAIDFIKDGVKGGDAHIMADDVISATKFKGKFTHSLGHSIGLAVHDGGLLHPSADITLKAGMVFTVEPGIYVKGYGGVRIEDDIVVKKNGVELLTTAPKELLEV